MTAPVVEEEAAREAGWRDVAAVLLGRAGARLGRITAVVRPAAWQLMALAAVLSVAGRMLSWQVLTIVGTIIAVVLAVCALFLIGRTTYDIALDLARTRVVVGERAYGALKLANRSGRAILPSRIVLPVGGGRGEFSVQRLAPGAEAEELFAIPTHRRGVVEVGPVSIVRGDPLGLFERAHRRDEPVDLFVHPKTTLFQGQSLGFLRDLEGLPATDLSRDDVNFHALSEYQPGDDLRRVHWRSTARTGVMMVRQYEETRRSHFVIGLSTARADYASADEFELAVSAAGSVGLRALRDSQEVELRVQGRELPAATGKRLLDSLAAVEHTKPREGGVQALAGVIAAALPQASVVVLVVGSSVDGEVLRAACARLPFGARVLVIIAADGVPAPELRRIGDADVISIGALDQLPPAMRKVLA